MPVAKTDNDELVDSEAAFIASMVAKDAPKVAPVVAKDAPTAVDSAVASAVTKEPPVPVVASGDSVPPTTQADDPPAGDDAKDPPVTPPDGAGDDEVAEIPDDAFQAAMAAEHASLSLDALPEAARPIVQKKIKDLESGWHNSMRKLAADRKDIATVKAEERFRTERPDDFVVTMLLADPTLMDRVNAKLDEVTASPTAREAHGVVVERAREKAKAAEFAALDAEKARGKRAAEVEKIGRAASTAVQVPYELAGVEAMIAAHIAIKGEITEPEIKGIVAERATLWKKHLREQDRLKAGKYASDKAKDIRTAGLAVRPATGTTPAPSAGPKPTTDDEFVAMFAAKLGGNSG
jgi:hypothetical protein